LVICAAIFRWKNYCEITMNEHLDLNVSKALAFFLRALAVGILIYAVRWW